MIARAPYGSNKARLVALQKGQAIEAENRARAFTLYATGYRMGIRISLRAVTPNLWKVLRVG